jgi:hypothetical protein
VFQKQEKEVLPETTDQDKSKADTVILGELDIDYDWNDFINNLKVAVRKGRFA